MAEGSGASDLEPILLDGSGRDGTTLAMQLLATSPEIAFDRIYPYEQRYFSYLLHWSRLPERDSWDESRWGLDHLSHSDDLDATDIAGPLPWLERSLIGGSGPQDLWQEVFAAVWTAFSRRAREAMRSQLGEAGLEVRYYAQKNAETWLIGAEEIPLPRVRVVPLLRDPRDIWISSVAFHESRRAEGHAFLPLADDEPVETYLPTFIEDQRTRLRWLRQWSDRGEAPIVRYENLIADLPSEARRLGEQLGLRLDADAVLRRRQTFGGHMTARSPELSVGRWRDEMSPELAARFSEALGPELVELGYEA